MGAISQMSAGLTHYVSPSRLSYIASHVPKIVILSGDVDQLVNPENSGYLVKHMPGAERLVWKGNRHSVNTQDPERFNALIERAIGEGLSGGMMEKKTQ
jgi:pimeloyl-ACP methyl ester carboxylesterase